MRDDQQRGQLRCFGGHGMCGVCGCGVGVSILAINNAVYARAKQGRTGIASTWASRRLGPLRRSRWAHGRRTRLALAAKWGRRRVKSHPKARSAGRPTGRPSGLSGPSGERSISQQMDASAERKSRDSPVRFVGTNSITSPAARTL